MDNEWKHFIQDAADDLRAMKITYDAGLYGISAYHCQQCLEKTIKAILLRYCTPKINPKKLTHMPMIHALKYHVGCWEAFAKLNNIENKNDSIDKQTMQIFSRKIYNKNTKLWWKESLNIPRSKDEDERWGRMFLDADPDNDTVLDLSLKTDQKQQYDHHCSFCFGFMKRFKTYNSDYSLSNHLSNLGAILDHIVLLIALHGCISPHEEIGRYTEIIDGKSTRQWYQIKKQELQILENHVSDVFDHLKKTYLD